MAIESTRTARRRLSGPARPASGGKARQLFTVPGTDFEVSRTQAIVGGAVTFAIVLVLATAGGGGGGSSGRGLIIRSR